VLGPSQTPWIYPSIHLEKKEEKKFPTEHRDDFSLRGGAGGGGAHSNSAPLMERVSMMMMFK
jgi:hypothetical protein